MTFARLASRARSNCKGAILMSGVGTNASAILAKQHLFPNIYIEAIISDRPSNAEVLAQQFQRKVLALNCQRTLAESRKALFATVADFLVRHDIGLLIYAGF